MAPGAGNHLTSFTASNQVPTLVERIEAGEPVEDEQLRMSDKRQGKDELGALAAAEFYNL